MMATSMDDILSDKEPEKPEAPENPEAPEQPERPEAAAEAADKPSPVSSKRKEHQRKEWEAQGRDPETGQFTKKADEPKSEVAAGDPKAEAKPEAKPEVKAPEKAAQPEMTEREKAFLKALEAERRKRQEFEQELARARQPAAPAAPVSPKKGFWDDPDAALQSHEQQVKQLATTARLETAEMIARSRYTDFDEKIEKFAELVQVTPGLAQQWLASRDPGEFAYRTAANHMTLAQAGNLDNLRAEIEKKARAEERAKVEAEFKAKEEERERQRAALPPSLTDVHGAGRKPQPQWTGPTSMSDILKH